MITNIRILNFIKKVKENFSMLFLYPSLFTLVAVLILVLLKQLNLWNIFLSFVGISAIYIFFWFFSFGEKKKELHEGDE